MPKRVASATFQRQKRGYRKRTGSGTGPRLGQPWEAWEERLVLEHEISDRELAERIGRSVLAIGIKRTRLRGLA